MHVSLHCPIYARYYGLNNGSSDKTPMTDPDERIGTNDNQLLELQFLSLTHNLSAVVDAKNVATELSLLFCEGRCVHLSVRTYARPFVSACILRTCMHLCKCLSVCLSPSLSPSLLVCVCVCVCVRVREPHAHCFKNPSTKGMYTLTAGIFFGWKLGKLYGIRYALAPYAVSAALRDVTGQSTLLFFLFLLLLLLLFFCFLFFVFFFCVCGALARAHPLLDTFSCRST